jgi:serine/threonine protein kinase
MSEKPTYFPSLQVFDENKQSFSFVTERIICSLADILHRFDGIPGGQMNCSQYLEENGTLSEIEISRGLLNITEGLQYMHHIQRKLHANVSPENIVIVSGGQWKLCGFGHSLGFTPDDFKAACPYFIAPQSSVNIIRLEPDLRYCSMEMTHGGYNPTNARYRMCMNELRNA